MQKQPEIKLERNDLTFPPQSQTQLQQEAAVIRTPENQHELSSTHSEYHPEHGEKTKYFNIEKLPDFPSIKGIFGWTVIDNVNIPYILRKERQFVSVRILELKLLSRYPKSFSIDFRKHAPFKSYSVTENEAKLLNEINFHHCNEEYGKKDFDTNALIVPLRDFVKFFDTLKNAHQDAAEKRYKHERKQQTGWLQVKNTVTPYLIRDGESYVPLYVIQFAAGLLTNKIVDNFIPTKRECKALNNLCREVGVEFTFSEFDRLIKVKELQRVDPVDIIILPSPNPLKYAKLQEIQMIKSYESNHKPLISEIQMTQNPSIIQSNSKEDLRFIRSKEQTSCNRKAPESDINISKSDIYTHHFERIFKDESIRIAREQGKRAAMEQVAAMNLHLLKTPKLIQQNHNQDHLSLQQKGQQRLEIFDKAPASKISGLQNGFRTGTHEKGSIAESAHRPTSNFGSSPRFRSPPLISCSHIRVDSTVLSRENVRPTANSNTSINPIQAMSNQYLSYEMQGGHCQQYAEKDQVSFYHDPYKGNIDGKIPKWPIPPSSKPFMNRLTQMQSLFPSVPIHSSVSNKEKNSQKTFDKTDPERRSKALVPIKPTISIDDEARVELTFSYLEKEQTTQNVDLVTNESKQTTKQIPPNTFKIQAEWINNRSISCLELTRKDRNGRYCLVEAVCQLYFDGCGVDQLIYAFDKVLNVHLFTCSGEEEIAFIKHYNLPVDSLKCNKMVKFEDFKSCFPQLTYMFPDKKAIDVLLAQESVKGHNPVFSDTNKLSYKKMPPLIKARDVLNMTLKNRIMKRHMRDRSKGGQPGVKARRNTVDDDAIIVLD